MLLTLAPLGVGIALAETSAPSESASHAPKSHVLFMGTDIALEKDKEFHPVEGVTVKDVIIKSGGTHLNVPLLLKATLSITSTLKIANASVEIANLNAERAYSPATDPFRAFARAASLAAGQSGTVDLAQGKLLQAQMLGSGETDPAVAAQIASAESAIDSMRMESTREIYDVGTLSVAAGSDESAQMFDAIRATFFVTSERPLAEPYFALIAQIRDRDAKPGHVRVWTYLKTLGSMGAGESRRVDVYQSGLPPGYHLENYEVHVYDRAVELATNLSRKRIELTEEEALQFKAVEYVSANKGKTLPAVPVIATVAEDVRTTLTSARPDDTFYVHVTKDGRVTAAYRDFGGTKPLDDPVLESALKTLRFNPALETGKPVESIVQINPRQLVSM